MFCENYKGHAFERSYILFSIFFFLIIIRYLPYKQYVLDIIFNNIRVI